MATDKTEISKLDLGMANDTPDRGPVLVNVHGQGPALRIRDGFGQLGQWDVTQGYNPFDSGKTTGVEKVLRSVAIRSDFGKVQVLTLVRTFGNTFDTAPGAGVYGRWSKQYALHVYDVTSGTHAEYALHNRTLESDPVTVTPQDVRPWGTSNAYDDRIVPHAADDDDLAFMEECLDTVIFGTPRAGTWCYRPTMFEQPEDQTGTVLVLKSRRGEGAAVSPIIGIQGQFKNYNYLTDDNFPVVTDVCMNGERVVYASGRSLFFSDGLFASNIMSGNEASLPLQGEITAIASVFDNICVWTREEFGIFRPAAETFAARGSWRLVSREAGCSGPSAKFVSNSGAIWAGPRGLFSTSGQYDIDNSASALQSLFIDGIGSPLSAFLATQQGGYTPPTGDTPRLQWLWRDLHRISMAYDERREMLLVCLPSEQIMLCRIAGNWTIFTTESRADNFPTSVDVSSLRVEQVCSIEGRIFAACGPESLAPFGIEAGTIASWYLLELGRGGAVDRSVELPEDNRQHNGWWTHDGAVVTDDPVISFGKPTDIWQGWTASVGGTAVGANGGWLIPVTLQPTTQVNGTPVGYIFADVSYDSTKWDPLLVGAGPAIDVVWPNERLATLAGWTIQRPAPGTITMTYNSVTKLNLSTELEQPLFYLPMTRVSTAPNDGPDWGYLNVPFVGVTNIANVQARLRFWRQFDRNSKNIATGAYILHNDDDVAQPVDWLYKWAQIDFAGQGRLREIFLRALTHGQGSDGLAPAWLWGLLNVYYSSDWKDWSGQIVDWSGWQNELASKATPLRARVKDASAAMIGRVFGGGLKWGSTADKTKGNFLADDEQVDTLAFSDSVRGETASLMLFGFVRDKAETLMLREVVARAMKVGGRRRIGR